MEIEITKDVKVKEIINVEFPYYYKQEFDTDYGDHAIYGKIIDNSECQIHENKEYSGGVKYEIEKGGRNDCYFSPEYKSSEKEYEAAKARAMEFLNVF